jgi:hypothetical protein
MVARVMGKFSRTSCSSLSSHPRQVSMYEGELQCVQCFVVVSGFLSLLLAQPFTVAGIALICLMSLALASRAIVFGVFMT